MMGVRPYELLNLPPLERDFAIECAIGLEKARWERWSKLFGG